jgi:hypothetical protein
MGNVIAALYTVYIIVFLAVYTAWTRAASTPHRPALPVPGGCRHGLDTGPCVFCGLFGR